MAKKSPRQQAIDLIIANLEKDYDQVKIKISQFKNRHAQLVNEQTILKRKRAELHKLIKGLKENRLPENKEPTQ